METWLIEQTNPSFPESTHISLSKAFKLLEWYLPMELCSESLKMAVRYLRMDTNAPNNPFIKPNPLKHNKRSEYSA